MGKTRKYEEWLIEPLKDPKAAALEEDSKGDAESKEVFAMALKNLEKAKS